MSNKNEFNANKIKILDSDIDKVRVQTGVYLGSVTLDGIQKTIGEGVDNIVDESKELEGDRVVKGTIVLQKNKEVILLDSGRGVPTDIHPQTQEPVIYALFTILAAGSKIKETEEDKKEDDDRKATIGTHGMGMTATNGVSEYFDVYPWRHRNLERVMWEQGKRTVDLTQMDIESVIESSEGLLKECFETLKTYPSGTLFRFKPDETIMSFTSEDGENMFYNVYQMDNTLKEYMLFNKNIEFELIYWDSQDNEYKRKEYKQSEYSIESVIKEKGNTYSKLILQDDKCKIEYDFNIQDYGEKVTSINGLKIPMGQHINGFNRVMVSMVRKELEDVIINELPIMDMDCIGKIVYSIQVTLKDPIFSGQAKENLASIEPYHLQISKLPQAVYNDSKCRKWFNELVGKIKEDYLIRLANYEKVNKREDVKATNEEKRKWSSTALHATGKGGKKILIMCEGESAANPIKAARDPDVHGIIDLQGKTKNTIKGGEYERLRPVFYTIENYDYDLFIIITDADDDGRHIRAVTLGNLYKRYPELIEEGRVLVGVPPLYRIKYTDGSVYAIDDDHKEEILNERPNPLDIKRFKGLGSMTADETLDFLENGTYIQPEVDDLVEEYMNIYLGKRASDRTDLILENVCSDRMMNEYKKYNRVKYTVDGNIFDQIEEYENEVVIGETYE